MFGRTRRQRRRDRANGVNDRVTASQVVDPLVCRECGCTPDRACWHMDFGGCGWAEPALCTACTPDSGPGWEHPALEATDA